MEAIITKEKIQEYVHELTVNMVHIGSKEVNYRILESLPTNIKDLTKTLEISNVPVYRKVNELYNIGLLDWRKGTGELTATDLTKTFIEAKKEMEGYVTSDIEQIIKIAISDPKKLPRIHKK